MNALWWWIDRWRKSTAYTDMTLAEQGAYRNLLDEATLRGGLLPDNDRILGKASGDALAWPMVRDVVLRWFTRTPNGWRNETLDAVLKEGRRRAKKQAAYRSRKSGNDAGNERSNDAGNEPGNTGGYPDPDLDQSISTPPNPPAGAGGRFTRGERTAALAALRAFRATQPRYVAPVQWAQDRPGEHYPEIRRCPHVPECGDDDVCITQLMRERRQAPHTGGEQ